VSHAAALTETDSQEDEIMGKQGKRMQNDRKEPQTEKMRRRRRSRHTNGDEEKLGCDDTAVDR